MAGDEWWQQLISYGLGRKWDAEYLLPFTAARDQQYFRGVDGSYYKAGEPIPASAMNPFGNPMITLALLAGGAVLLIMLLKD